VTETYEIVRFYRDREHPNHQKVMQTGLTLEEAQKHCRDPNTRGDWFDGYRKER
jgi:hypothetical protein